jgi:hypothetical protein
MRLQRISSYTMVIKRPFLFLLMVYIYNYHFYSPYFDKPQVGLCNLHALCVSVYPPPH